MSSWPSSKKRCVSCLFRLNRAFRGIEFLYLKHNDCRRSLKCLATGRFASLLMIARLCLPNLVLNGLTKPCHIHTCMTYVNEVIKGAHEIVHGMINKLKFENNGGL